MLSITTSLLFSVAQAATEQIAYNDDACVAHQKVYVATHQANLRVAPDMNAEIVGKIQLGDEGIVLQRLNETRIGGRAGVWCQVQLANGQTGAMFSPTLSTHRWQRDLDEDGSPEDIFVVYNKEHHIVVNIRSNNTEPGMIDIGGLEDMGGFLDQAEVELPEGLGLPLLRIYVPGSQQCGGFSQEFFLAWRKGPNGVASGAVVLKGSTGGDAPVYTTTTFRFIPEKREVIQEQTFGEALDNGETAEDITTYLLRWNGQQFIKLSETKRHEGPPRSN